MAESVSVTSKPMLYVAPGGTTFLRRPLWLRCLYVGQMRETQETPRVTRCLPGHALRAPLRCRKQPPRRQVWVQEWRRPCSHCSFTPHLTVLLKSHPLALLVIENRNRQGFPFLGCPGRKAGLQSREKAGELKHSTINESTRCVPGAVLSALRASAYVLFKCL